MFHNFWYLYFKIAFLFFVFFHFQSTVYSSNGGRHIQLHITSDSQDEEHSLTNTTQHGDTTKYDESHETRDQRS